MTWIALIVRRWFICVGVVIAGLAPFSTAQMASTQPAASSLGTNSQDTIAIARELAETWRAKHSNVPVIEVGVCRNLQGLDYLKSGKLSMLLYTPTPVEPDTQPASADDLERYLIGTLRVSVVVNNAQTMKQLKVSDISRVLAKPKSGQLAATWDDIGGSSSKQVMVYGQFRNPLFMNLLRSNCLLVVDKGRRGWRMLRPDVVNCDSAEDVVKKVRSDPTGIGLYAEPATLPQGIHVVSIIADDGNRIQPGNPDYPFRQEFAVYVLQTASQDIRDLTKFCLSREGATICTKYGLVTPWYEENERAQKRLADVKTGKGPKATIIGSGRLDQFTRELGTEYVKAKAVAQVDYQPAADQQAIATFVNNPSSDMMLLEGSASDAAIKPVKDKWDDMVSKGMRKHTLASRSVAIVVNSVNKLDSLSLDQVRDIFTGKISDWNIIGKDLVPAGTGDVSSSVFIGPSKPSADARRGIILYGLASPTPGAPGNVPDPYFALFTRAIGQSKLATYQAKKDSAEAIAAVAMDPAAIAFVDASQLSAASGKAIKVLAIGEPGKAVLPQSAAVLDGTYPISEPITLYFMPKPDPVSAIQPTATQPANPTTGQADLPYKIINMPTSQSAMTPAQTKADFVTFILSGAPVETFRTNGLICRGMDVIPPPPATKPAVEPAKNPKDRPHKPSKPADTQPANQSKPDLPVWK